MTTDQPLGDMKWSLSDYDALPEAASRAVPSDSCESSPNGEHDWHQWEEYGRTDTCTYCSGSPAVPSDQGASIVCMTYPDCDREHAGGAGGVPVHPPEGAIIGGDEPAVPSDHTATTEPDLADATGYRDTATGRLVDDHHTATTEDPLDSLPYFTFEDDEVAPDEEFVRKADVARLLATARPDTTTTVEWAVRGQHTGTITPQHSEKHAQAIANALPYYSVVRREVSAWTEADQ